MFEKVVAETTKLVDSRFLYVAFFPTVALVLALVLILAQAANRRPALLSWWAQQSGAVQFVAALAAVATVLVLATFVDTNINRLIRFLEGYHVPKYLSRRLTELQGARKAKLGDDAYLYYPRTDLLPTSLGNVLRAAERYPLDAYGTYGVVVWPRLYSLLPTEHQSSIDAARRNLDFSVVVCAYSLFTAVAGGTGIALLSGGRALFAWTVGIGVLLAYLTYRSALDAAVGYGMSVTAAYDLHRRKVLAHLRLGFPSTVEEERRLWSVVDRLARGRELPHWWRYMPDEKEA